MSTPVTLFIQKPLTNINTLLQKYNIYVHENIDGKTTCRCRREQFQMIHQHTPSQFSFWTLLKMSKMIIFFFLLNT